MGKVAELGKNFYEEKLKPIFEPQENGKFVSIEPDSGKYFVANTDVEAVMGNTFFKKKIWFLQESDFRQLTNSAVMAQEKGKVNE